MEPNAMFNVVSIQMSQEAPEGCLYRAHLFTAL